MHRSNPDAPTVLLVDDSDVIRLVLRMQLTVLGYAVVEAADGREAVAVARRERPDLILMDISMPGLDGLAATCLIHAAAETRETPVVAFTAYDGEDVRAEARAAGCSDYATKPLDVEELAGLIARNLRRPAGRSAEAGCTKVETE